MRLPEWHGLCDQQVPLPNTSAAHACVGNAGGNPMKECCRYDQQKGCNTGWYECSWHGEERIAWIHTPKTGTSFLLALALLANRSLPLHKATGALTLQKGSPIQWSNFFAQFPHSKWFRGSSVFWLPGIEHAAVGAATYA